MAQSAANWRNTRAHSRGPHAFTYTFTSTQLQPQAKQTRVRDCFGIDYTKAIPNSCLFCLWLQPLDAKRQLSYFRICHRFFIF